MDGMIQVQVIGDKQFIDVLSKLPVKLNPAMKDAMKRSTFLVRQTVRDKYLRGPRPTHLAVVTSNLINRIDTEVKGSGMDLQGIIGTNVDYARIWEEGGTIRAHTIVPRHAKWLHFLVNGQDVFAKSVRIPARRVEPRPFLKPGLRDSKEPVFQIFLGEVKKAVDGV